MAEIDSLGSNFYYSGVQNAANEAIKRNQKKEEIKKSEEAKKTGFAKLLKGEEVVEPQFIADGLPPEVRTMTIDDAAVYLADAVGNAGNLFSESRTQENLEEFKTAVSQFIRFVVVNNYEVNLKQKRQRLGKAGQPPRMFFFSDYSVPPGKPNPKVSIQIINEKLDALARETLTMQASNLNVLAKVNEIKGLIVDLMSS